ncbi:MAG: menaquinone biosynthesis protein [Bacteroidales bacterium]|nr:menaquinone biosynthesis protein [Bacteroidales bacterium]
MEKTKIVLVSYHNSLPFLYGLQHSEYITNNCDIITEYPSKGANMLLNGECDIALVPVGIIPQLKISYIVSKFCIGAEGRVRSVLLVSQVPLEMISKIYLDYQSATSVRLCKILARHYWNINPDFLDSQPGYEQQIKGTTAGVIIGDRCFQYSDYKYKYDLAEEWINFTGFPFVFAAWLSTRPVKPELKMHLNDALEFGISNIDNVIQAYKYKFAFNPNFNAREYYTKNISYYLNEGKSRGMNTFIKYVSMEDRAMADPALRQMYAQN